MSRSEKQLAIIDDDLTDIGKAEYATMRIWQRLSTMAQRTYLTIEDIDVLSDELRQIETGLATVKKHILVLRGQV